MKQNPIIRITVKLLLPFILLFALYVQFHGDLGHIPNAKLIVLNTIPNKLSEIPKDKTVVFVCRSGGRSARATAHALEHGYTDVYNLKGGMILWNELHLETEM